MPYSDRRRSPAAPPVRTCSIASASTAGSFAPGAGPVVAPDGTVYLGNEQGKLMSFKPDGTPGWILNAVEPVEALVAN